MADSALVLGYLEHMSQPEGQDERREILRRAIRHPYITRQDPAAQAKPDESDNPSGNCGSAQKATDCTPEDG